MATLEQTKTLDRIIKDIHGEYYLDEARIGKMTRKLYVKLITPVRRIYVKIAPNGTYRIMYQ